MTRKEQIQQAASGIADFQGMQYFILGATWADKTFAEYVRKMLQDHMNDLHEYLLSGKPHGRARAELCFEYEIYEGFYLMIGEMVNPKTE